MARCSAFGEAHQRHREHLSWTTVPHGVPPSRENKPENTFVRTGCRDKNNKAREAYYKDLGTVLNSKRKHRWRLTLPRWCQPYQGPLEVICLNCPSCLVCNDTCFMYTS